MFPNEFEFYFHYSQLFFGYISFITIDNYFVKWIQTKKLYKITERYYV